MNGDIPFDAITTFFVFLIGLPAFVFQWLAPEIRPIIVKRSSELLIDAGTPVVVALLLVGVGIRYARCTRRGHLPTSRPAWMRATTGCRGCWRNSALRCRRKRSRVSGTPPQCCTTSLLGKIWRELGVSWPEQGLGPA